MRPVCLHRLVSVRKLHWFPLLQFVQQGKDTERPKLLCLQKTFWEKRAETTQCITSSQGIHPCLCRSIQVEIIFALMKYDLDSEDSSLAAMPNPGGAVSPSYRFCPKKLWMKRERGHLQTCVSKKMTA